jgi:hypothetical protein
LGASTGNRWVRYSWSDWHSGSILQALFSERVSAFGK